VFAPFEVNVTDCPAQIAGGVFTVTTGNGFIVTVTCVVAVQPFASPVTVYVVVEVGLAVTEEPVVALNPVAGLHEYVFAPFAVSIVD
jgi:hypothetical protein